CDAARTRPWWHSTAVAACLASQLVGCRTPQDTHYLGQADLQYYKQSATQVDYPDVDSAIAPAITYADRPPTIRDPLQLEAWEMTLEDALQLALNNSPVLRSRGAFKNPGNPLMANPERAASRFDVALQESNSSFFQRGVESALSAFDTQFKTSMDWGRDEN